MLYKNIFGLVSKKKKFGLDVVVVLSDYFFPPTNC